VLRLFRVPAGLIALITTALILLPNLEVWEIRSML